MAKYADIRIGTKSGRLTVVEDLGIMVKDGTKTKTHYIKCKCDCGNEVVISATKFNTGRVLSCGCIREFNNKKYNEYCVCGDITFVKFSNCNEYFLCDTEDWEKLKRYCWYKDTYGYAKTKPMKDGFMSFHRVVTECPDELVPNHIYPVSMGVCDNRKSNLEIVTQRENSIKSITKSNNTSGYRGVYWNKQLNKWFAKIIVNGKQIHLGVYDNIIDAVQAREKADVEYGYEYEKVKK